MRPRHSLPSVLILVSGMLCLHRPLAQGAESVTSVGSVIVEPSALISAGFEWPIEGDANRNATVAVVHRRKPLRPD